MRRQQLGRAGVATLERRIQVREVARGLLLIAVVEVLVDGARALRQRRRVRRGQLAVEAVLDEPQLRLVVQKEGRREAVPARLKNETYLAKVRGVHCFAQAIRRKVALGRATDVLVKQQKKIAS